MIVKFDKSGVFKFVFLRLAGPFHFRIHHMLFPRRMARAKYAATSVCFARVSRTHSEMLRAQGSIIAHGGRKKKSSISLI